MTVFSNLWAVLLLFLIPIGGGIPAGVLLAQSKGIAWPVMMLLYLISDIILACAFEPILMLFIKLGKKIEFFARLSYAMKLSVQKTLQIYGNSSNLFALVMIAFGVDPMTGRAVTVAAGHNFVVGWMVAITGDMMYFTLVMVSTLWLQSVLGDGTWTMIIIFALMMVIPQIYKRIKNKVKTSPSL